MRQPVKYYHGFEITDDVIRKINLIELKRIEEGLIELNPKEISDLKDLCLLHGTFPNDEFIILGEDWYIIYTKFYDELIEIADWVSIGNTKDKLAQSLEMISAMKKILLENSKCKILATMRHSTSYKFYQSMLKRGYLEEISQRIELDDELPLNLQIQKAQLKLKYKTLEEYILNSDKEPLKTHLPDYIYHLIVFKPTTNFTKKYSKKV